MPTPSDRISMRAALLFGARAREVTAILGELDVGRQSPDRVHAAVLLLSDGDWDRFVDAVRLAVVDWRDVLVAARLADGDWPERLDAYLDGG